MIARFARFVVRYRSAIVAANVLLFAVAVRFAVRLEFESTPEIWFRPTDPARVAYDQLHEYFGDDEFVLLVIEDPERGIFRNKALAAVDRLSRALEDAPYINKVQSVTEFQWIHGEDDSLLIDDLLKKPIEEMGFPLPEEIIAHAKKVVLGDELAVGLLVDAKGTAAAVLGRVERLDGTFAHKVELTERIFEIVAEEKAASGYEVYYAGSPVIDYAFFTYSLQDNKVLVPALYGLIILVLYIVFRRLTGVVYPLLVVIVSTATVVGGIVAMDSKLQTMTAMLPMLLIAVCIADSIHVVVVFFERLREDLDRKIAAQKTIEDLFIPCFLTSFTTAVGFGSLASSDMPPLSEYGGLAACGVLLAFAVSITLLPALLSYGRVPRSFLNPTGLNAGAPSHAHPGEEGYRDRTLALLRRMDRFTRAHPGYVLAGSLALTGLAIWGITLIKTETVALEFFRGKSPIRQYTRAIERVMGGSANIEIVVDTGEEDGAKNPERLRDMEKVQRYLDTFPEVTKSLSLPMFVKRINRSLHGEDEEFYRLPDEQDFVAQLLLLYTLSDPKEDLSDMVDYPYRHARLSARIPFLSSERSVKIVAAVKEFLAKETPELRAEPTGLLVLYNNMGSYVNKTLRTSFLMAIAIITLTIGLSLRSPRVALLSMIPNILPIVWVLGLMGFVGIHLDVGTVMVAGITIGIAVDDTIHFLARYAYAVRRGATPAEAIDYVLRHSGRAIVFTSVILMGAFWMLVFAQFLPTAYLGLISGITIAFALVADLLLLPALLYLWRPRIRGRTGENWPR